MNNDGLPAPLTEQAETIANVWVLFLIIAVGVFGLIVVLLGYVTLRFRRRDNKLPPQTHYNIGLEVAYTIIPLVLVIALFVVTVRTIRTVEATPDSPDLTVDVVGFQWQWQFTYPDSGVVVVGDDDTEPPELVLPSGSSVRFNLESRDVIHSFWVPGFLFKRDLIPGTPTSFDADVNDETGRYDNGACAEFCGLYHGRMTFSVRIVSPDDFDRWLADQGSISQGNGS